MHRKVLVEMLRNPEATGWDNSLICEAFSIEAKELAVLRAVSRNDPASLGVALYVVKQRLPIEVCIHSTRSIVPLGLRFGEFKYDVFILDFAPVSANLQIQLAIATLAGKIASFEESFCWSRARLFQSLLKSDNLEWSGFKLNDKESGFKSLETWTKKATGWSNWHERSGYVTFVKSAITELLFRIVPPESRAESKSWTILEMETSKPSYLRNDGLFDDLHCCNEIAYAVRRAEGVTAILEQKERDALAPNWLFKEELKLEKQQLLDWTSSPELIRSIKVSLSKRIDAVFEKEHCDEDLNFSEDSWCSYLVDEWTETYEPIVVCPNEVPEE